MLLVARLLDLRANSHSLGLAHELRLWGIGGVLFGVFAALMEWLREERRFREAESVSGSPTV